MGDGKDKVKHKSSFEDAFDDAVSGHTPTVVKEVKKKPASFSDAFDDAATISGTQAGLVKKKEGGVSSSQSSPELESTDTDEGSPSSSNGEVVAEQPIPATPVQKSAIGIPGVSAAKDAVKNAARDAKLAEANAVTKPAAVDPVTQKKTNPFRSLTTGNTAQFVNLFADANKLLGTDIDLDNNTKLANFGDLNKDRNPESLTSVVTSRNGVSGGKMPTAKDKRVFDKEKVLTDPENLRQYNLTRQKQMKDRADEIRNRQAEIVSKSNFSRITDLINGGADDEQDVIEMNNLNKELKELGSFQQSFTGAVADVAKVRIPEKHIAKGSKPTNEEIGLEFLKTIGDPTVTDDEKDLKADVPVTDAVDLLNWNKNQRALDYTKEKIRYKFEATGAEVMTDFYSHASDRAFEVAKPKLERLANLYDKHEEETDPAQKEVYRNAISTLRDDADVQAYISNTTAAVDYYDQAKNAIDKFPQVKREQIRRDVNDAFFSVVDSPELFKSSDIKGLMRKFGPANWIFGETPSKEDIAEMAKISGHTEAEVKEAMNIQREGFFASAPEGVRIEGFLTGVAKSVDETLGKTVQGARRILNTPDASIRNRMVGDKMEDYMFNGGGNDLIDKMGGYHVNPYSISSVFGRGIGQMTIYGAPALLTGGIGGMVAEGLGASLKAANTAAKISEGTGTVLSGMAGSYEDAYKEAALQSPDESVRRGYATLNSLANALPELFYSPAEMLKGTGNIFRKKVIPNLFKEFSEVAAKKGVSAAIYNGLGKAMNILKESGDVLLAENIEEQATNLGTNALDQAFFNKERSPAELAKQAEETFIMTTLQTLPMAVGAGIHGANDISHVKKQALFEAGVEADLYKDKLKELFDSGALNQAQLNEKVATVNTMHSIVTSLPEVNHHGQPLSYDDKVLIAAQQYRIQVNNRRAATTTVEAEKENVAADNKEASAIQQQILAGEGVYMLDGQPVSREDAAKEIENGTGKFIQISNDPGLQKRLNEVGQEVENKTEEYPEDKDVSDFVEDHRKNIQSDIDYFGEQVEKNKPSTFGGKVRRWFSHDGDAINLNSSKKELSFLNKNPIGYFENYLESLEDYDNENPDDPNRPELLDKYRDIISRLKQTEKGTITSHTSGRVAEVANKIATNQPLTKAEHSIIEANKEEVLSTLEAVPEIKTEEDPEAAASSLLAEALKAEPVVEQLTPEQQSAVDVLHGMKDKLPKHYQAMVDVDPIETIRFIAEQAHESKGKKKTVEQKFGTELVASSMKLFPPKPKEESQEVVESGKVENVSSPKTNTDEKDRDSSIDEGKISDNPENKVEGNEDAKKEPAVKDEELLNEPVSTSSDEPAGTTAEPTEQEMRDTYAKAFGKEYDASGIPLPLAYKAALRKLKSANAIEKEKALPLVDAEQNTNTDIISKGTEDAARTNGEAQRNHSPEDLKRRVEASRDWLKAFAGNDKKASRDAATELFRKSDNKERQKGQGVLPNINERGKTVSAQGSDGGNIGTEIIDEGTRASQGSQRTEQSSGQPATTNGFGSLETSQQGTPEGTLSNDGGLTETERRSVVEAIRSLSNVQDDGVKTRSERYLQKMLQEELPKSLLEVVDLITKNINEDGTIRQQVSATQTLGDQSKTGSSIPAGNEEAIQKTTGESKAEEEKEIADLLGEAVAQLPAEDIATLEEAGVSPIDVLHGSTAEGDITPASLETLIEAGKKNGNIIIGTMPKISSNENNASNQPSTEGAADREVKEPATDGGSENQAVQEGDVVSSPIEKTPEEKRKDKIKAAKEKFKATLKKSRGQLNFGIDPQLFADLAEMLIAYAEDGVHRLSAIIKSFIKDGDTEFVKDKDNIRVLRTLYAAYREDLPRDERVNYDTTEQLDDFFDKEFPVLLNSIDDIEDNAGDFTKQDQQFDNTQKAEPHIAFKEAVKDKIKQAISQNIVSLRKLAKDVGLDASDIELQELSELAVVEEARKLAGDEKLSHEEKLKRISELYNRQPSLNQRSSTRVELQQYSTPAPISYLGGHFINGISPNRVFEPSAGNGLLTIAFPTNIVSVNEIDETRLRSLELQNFRSVSSQDATEPFKGLYRSQDGVITNPPFGSADVKVYDGYKIRGLAPQMAINALETMKDNGRAAIIIGGHNSYDDKGILQKERFFFNYLYNHYNIADVINIDGQLYSKQGTSFDIRMILINGRKSQPNGFAPTQSQVNSTVVKSFTELDERIKNLNYENSSQSEDGQRDVSESVPGESQQSGPEQTGNIATVTTETGGTNTDQSGTRGEPGRNGGRNVGGQSSSSQSESDGTSTVSNADGSLPVNDATVSTGTGTRDSTKSGGGQTDLRPNKPVQSARQLTSSDIAQEKIKYDPVSEGRPVNTVIPTQMASEAQRFLNRIDAENGGLDNYVMEALGYPSTNELFDAFSAEQIDALAMSIYQIENNNGMVIGDMTGVGKGRIAAGVIRYGVLHGFKPIFLTEKTALFSDMYRDLKAIGSKDLIPFIVNDYDKLLDPTITDEDGTVVYKSLPKTAKKLILESQQLPDDAQWVVASYSQFRSNPSKPSVKRDFFRAITQDNILIMDESHNAGGDGNTGELFQDVLEHTKGVTYLSATFAKTPKNMPVYSIKTAMREANMSKEELIAAIEKGGVALQEVVSSQLVESGQMLRRERNFDGVNIDYEMQSEHEQRDRTIADKVTDIIRDVIQFQERHVSPVISNLNAAAQADEGMMVGSTSGTSMAGVSNAPFASRVFNVVDQFLFAIKAEAAADAAIEELKKGRKPVLKFKSTMESFLTNEGFQIGDELASPDFSLALKRSLDTVMKYTTTSAGGDNVTSMLSPSDLFPDGRMEYARILDKVKKASTGISISPIDLMIHKIEKAGYTVGEITGRKMVVRYNDNGSAVVEAKGGLGLKEIVRGFNSGTIDVVMLNASGATGISLHASKDFKDQRQRVMISPQLELDINKEIQGRGRIDRTGQVVRGAYRYIVSSIPAELRLLMMFQAKVKSLDANTTSSQKSKTSQVDLTDDFLNKYGDEIVTEYLKEHPEVNEKLLDPLKLIGKSEDELATMQSYPDAARKTSGRVAILSSVEQEKFYKEVGERYKEYLEYKNSINENELEVKVLPLEARAISTTVAVVGKGGVSPFGADSILEKVEANILRKPMTKEELDKSIADALDGRDPNTIAKEMVKEMEEYFDKKIIDDRDEINKIIDEKLSDAGNTIADPEKLEARLQELEAARTAKIAQMENKMEGLRTNTRTRLSFFKIGRPLKISTTSNVSAGVNSWSNGVFLGFEIKANTKNRYAPSNVRLKFAVEDSRKQISVPSSQSAFLDSILAASYQRFSGMDNVIPNWGKGKANADRGIQYIVTGNVLQAYSEYKGQLVSYSTDKGELKKGILLNEGEIEGLKDKGVKVPFNKAFRFIADTLERGGVIKSADGDVELNVTRNRYTIEVPKSRQRGGKYFLNNKLRDIINNGEFTTIGNKMVSSFDAADLPSMLDVLTDEFGTNVNLSKAQAGIKEKKVDDNPKPDGDEFNVAEEAVRDALPSTMDYPVRAKETAGDALQRIAKGNGPFAGVARQLLQFADNVSLRVPFEVGPISDGRSYYDPISDTIYLTPNHANSDYVVLHEIIHAATAKKLPQGLDTIDKILDFINDPASDKNAVQLAKVYLQALANLGNDAYGLRSLDEFVAEVFTNPFFQRQLDNVAYKNTKQNLFQRFIEAVKNLLGISSPTLLDKAVRAGARIVSNSSRSVDRRGRLKSSGNVLHDALTNMALLRQQRGMGLGDFITEIQGTHNFGSTPAQKSTIRQAFEAAADIQKRIKAATTERELQEIVDSVDAPELKKNVQKIVDALPRTTTGAKIDPNDNERRFRLAADSLIRQGKSFTEIEAELGSFTTSEADYVRDATKARDMGREAAAEVIAEWKDAVQSGKAVSRAAESLLPALLNNRETLDALTDEFRLYEPQSEAEAYDFASHFVGLLGPTGVMEYFHKEKNNLEALYKTALLVKAIEGYRDDQNPQGEANAATELRKHITYSAQGLQSAQAAYKWLHISASLEAQQAFVQNIIDSINAKVEQLPAAKAIIEARDKMREELEAALGDNEDIKSEMENLIKTHQEEMAQAQAQAQTGTPPKTRKKKTIAEKTADAILKLKIKDDPGTIKANVFGAFVPLVNAALDTVATAIRIGGNIIDAIEEGLRDIKSKDPSFNLDDEFRNHVGSNIHIPGDNISTSAFVQSQIKGMVMDVFNGKTIDEVIDDRFFYLEDGPRGKLKRLIKHEMVIAAKAAKAKLKDRTLDEYMDDMADELNTGGTVTTMSNIAKIARAAGLSYITPAQVMHLAAILKSTSGLTGFQKAERIERVTNFLEQRDQLFTDSFLRSLMYLKPLLSYTFAAASIISNKFQVFNNAINTTVEDLIHNKTLDTRYIKLLFDSNVRKKANALATDIMLRGGIPIQNQLALLMPFAGGMPKSRLEEYQVDTTNVAKRWYNRAAQIMMSGANRLANVTDSPATYRIAQGELYQSIKDRIRADQPTLSEKQVQDNAWAEMNAVSLNDAMAQADAEYTNRGVIPFGNYSHAIIPKTVIDAAAKTRGILTSESDKSISREDAKYRRRVSEIMDESRDQKFEEEYVAAIQTASDLLFKERIGDSLKKSTPISKKITNGVGGLFTSVSNLFVNGMDAAFGNNKYTKFLSQNVVFSIVGYVNAAGNIMEKVLEADPRYAAVKIAALQVAKRNLSDADKKYITQRQVQVATNSIVSLGVMTLALAISKGLCKDKAIVTKGGKTEGDTVTGNLSICGMEIPVQFFPIQGRMLEVYSNVMNDPDVDEKTKESAFQATWIGLTSLGWDFFETDPGQYDQNITKAVNALMPDKSPFPIGEKKQKEEYGEKVQNWFQGQLASMTLNYVPISPTFFNQTAKYSNFFANNGKKYYRPTGDLDANSFVNFMNGYKQELANKSGYQAIINSMSKDATPYLDYRSRPVDRDYNSKRDAIDTYMKKYESSVNMFSKVYSPIYDSKKSDYRTMTDKEHYNYYKESTSRVDAWLKQNFPQKQEMYNDYVNTYGDKLKEEGKKVKPIDTYFIEKLKRAQSQIKKDVIEEQFGKDALINE